MPYNCDQNLNQKHALREAKNAQKANGMHEHQSSWDPSEFTKQPGAQMLPDLLQRIQIPDSQLGAEVSMCHW